MPFDPKDPKQREDLKALAAEVAGSWPAPWAVRDDYASEYDAFDATGNPVVWTDPALLRFVSGALEKVPALLDEVERLTEALQDLRDECRDAAFERDLSDLSD